MPKVVKMLQKSKGSLKHNAGPYSPITKKEVKSAGSLEKVYRSRSDAGSGRAGKVMTRMAEVGYPSDASVKRGTVADVGAETKESLNKRQRALKEAMKP